MMIDALLMATLVVGTPVEGVVHDAARPMTLVEQAVDMGYPACRTEDDITPCYWDASARGNGKGHDFVWTGDELLY